MCDSPELTARLDKLIAILDPAAHVQQQPQRPYDDATYFIGNTQSNLYLTYRGRKHLYLFSANALTLNLQDIGTLAVPANTWTDISFRENMQVFTTNQVTAVPVYVKATDELLPGAYVGGASIVNLHNADNQTVPSGNAQLVDNLAVLLNAIGKTDRQREVGADAAPSDGITTTASNLAQTQSSNATGAITAGQTTNAVITPTTITSGMVANQQVDIDFGTANQESGFIVSTTPTTLTVQPVNGSPSAPAWLNAHSGTYKVQVKAYNVTRDAKGENSGADGTGTAVALEYEWNSGGPPLASGNPSLDQYDRETLILGQGTDSQACNATTAGDTQITLTVAKRTLTPGAPIRMSGAALSETVYVDQSYVIGSNTVIPLKHPIVNTGQTLAAWQKYTPDGPGTNAVPLYGEGMEGVLLADATAPGFGRMWQGTTAGEANINISKIAGGSATNATYSPSGNNNDPGLVVKADPQLWNGATWDFQRNNLDNITLLASAAQTTTQTTADQTNFNARGVIVTLDATVNAGGLGSITLEIDAKDPVSGKYVALLTGAAVVSVTTNIYVVYPGATTVANATIGVPLPRTWRVKVTANNANPVTYSVGASLII